MQRIVNPPRPSLLNRIGRSAWAVEEFWCRHVAQRELYRRLDELRVVVQANLPPDRRAFEEARRGLQRIRDAVAAKQEKPD
ncbi:hypothetical protein AB0K71_15910 [Streptomyces syringium]|uniref:hypothetical protein n=1 Tax=Streptomyces syringium TaxID=76729 RepID=UPI00343BC06C